MATLAQLLTADRYFELGDIGPSELLRGELVMMSPAFFNHGWVVTKIDTTLAGFVYSRRLGIVVSGEAGFLLETNPDTVRVPDVAFIRSERMPPEGVPKFFPGAPDLAVEVLSPSDRPGDISSKVQDWLRAGCLVVWLVDPRTKTVIVHRRDAEPQGFSETDLLECPDLLPGFTVPVVEIFTL
ncbi:MAG: Uma2 family endonuclease [Pirellulales bacterium]|nr:Uma2 family endonuclease [Pirellulales bacterium]